MCPPKQKSSAPPAATLPTTQAADQLELVSDALDSGTPTGRQALSTRPRAGKPASAGAGVGATVAEALVANLAATTAASQPQTGGAADALAGGAPTGGRLPGSKQPFYSPDGSGTP